MAREEPELLQDGVWSNFLGVGIELPNISLSYRMEFGLIS